MAGTKPLVCRGFVEADTFTRSKGELMRETGMTEHEVDDRLEALVWGLLRGDEDDEAVVSRIPGRNLWVAVLPRGIPPLRVYLRPRPDVAGECEWMWIERCS
jgi:hypothetical protein